MRLRTVLAALIVILLAFSVSSVLRFDASFDGYADDERVRRDFFTSPALSRAPSSCDASTGAYVTGRTLRPTFSMDLCPCGAVQGALQRKEFVWLGATAGPWLAGVAVLQLQYVSVLTAQLFHAGTGESFRAQTAVPLLGARFVPAPGPRGGVGPAAPGHRVVFAAPLGTNRAEIRFDDGRVRLNFSGVARSSSGGAQQRIELLADAVLPDAFLGFVFPFGPRRASVVAKFAAAPLRSPLRIRVGSEEFEENGTLAMDYTRGLLRRRTLWQWACAAAPGGYGFHLSSGVYDVQNRSVESSVFAHGTVMLLDSVIEFTQGAPGEWSVTGGGVNLRFSKRDAHDGEIRLGIISANLDHAWGLFDGTIVTNGMTYKFDNVSGVLEDHDAYW